jgi:hypothetical protein
MKLPQIHAANKPVLSWQDGNSQYRQQEWQDRRRPRLRPRALATEIRDLYDASD